jgi:ADP-ribose pyrophosphatase YjhB (NUDIX family)
MFKKVEFDLDLVSSPFENLKYRDRTVLILIKNSKDKYLFGVKKFYPKAIKRMIGGGVDKDEDVIDAATRELSEELGIIVLSSQLQSLVEFKISGKFEGVEYKTSIFTCYLDIQDNSYKAGDDVSEVVEFSEDECMDIVEEMMNIDEKSVFENGENSISWADYGKVYGFVLKESLKELRNSENR